MNKNNIELNDIINCACINANSQDRLYFKGENSNEFEKVSPSDDLIIASADQLIVIWDENKKNNISTISSLYQFQNKNFIPLCKEIIIQYSLIEVNKEKSCFMFKVNDSSFLTDNYPNKRYEDTFKTPESDILFNPANQALLSMQLRKIFNILVKKR